MATDDVATGSLGYRRPADAAEGPRVERPMVQAELHVHGRDSVNELAAALSELGDVDAVLASDVNAIDE